MKTDIKLLTPENDQQYIDIKEPDHLLRERLKALEEENRQLKRERTRLEDVCNDALKQNKELHFSNKHHIQEKILQAPVGFDVFTETFPNAFTCCRWLAEMKWKDGYTCKRCGNTKYCNGKHDFARRCTRCRYDESASAYSILHGCKFSMVKAFYIIYRVYASRGEIKSIELSELTQLRQSTCWSFKNKVMGAMERYRKSNGAAYRMGSANGWMDIIWMT